MPFLLGILFVPIQSKCADMKPVDSSACQDASNVVRHILQIPFVDKPIDLTGFFVALVGGIGIIHNADKADTPERE